MKAEEAVEVGIDDGRPLSVEDEEDEDDEGDDEEEEEEEAAAAEDTTTKKEQQAKEYEESPVTRPFDIKGLMQIKQQKSKLDLTIYKSDIVSDGSSDGSPRIVSPEKPSESKTPPVVKKPVPRKAPRLPKTAAPRTLQQMLSLIETDVIHEEQHENDSVESNSGEQSDEGGNEEDFLDAQDQKILRDRILHAIEVFSRWTPNPKKEIMM